MKRKVLIIFLSLILIIGALTTTVSATRKNRKNKIT